MARTVVEAFQDYTRPIEAALACVTQAHFIRGRLVVDAPRALILQPSVVRLKRARGASDLLFTFLQGHRVFHDRDDRIRGLFWIQIESWTYSIYDSDNRDLLLYHWDPESDHPNPHLHVGSILLNTAGHELGRGFSKLHVATGPVSIQQIVRMLIEEFDVQPLRDDWDAVLKVLVESV